MNREIECLLPFLAETKQEDKQERKREREREEGENCSKQGGTTREVKIKKKNIRRENENEEKVGQCDGVSPFLERTQIELASGAEN